MASIYKKPVFVMDAKTGQKIKTKSKKWWGRYRDENGVDGTGSPGNGQDGSPGDAERTRQNSRASSRWRCRSFRRTSQAPNRGAPGPIPAISWRQWKHREAHAADLHHAGRSLMAALSSGSLMFVRRPW